MAGMGGTGGSGGENCALISDVSAIPNVFDPSKGEVTNIQINVLKSLNQLSLYIYTSPDEVLVNPLLNIFPTILPGQTSMIWNGKGQEGFIVPEGLYLAKATATTAECSAVKSVLVQVKHAVNNCTLDVALNPQQAGHWVLAGTAGAEMVCYDFTAGECPVAVESLALTQSGAGDDAKLTKNALYNGGVQASEFENFPAQSNRIVFNHALGINVQTNTTETVCMRSDVDAYTPAYYVYRMDLVSKSDITAFSPGQQLTNAQINGNFPVEGPSISVYKP